MDIHYLRQEKFTGFLKISDLEKDLSTVPKVMGVYIVLRPLDIGCSFKEIGTGGYFKNENPNEEISRLEGKWIDEAQVVYIGKTGGENRQSTLNSRIRQYLRFGQGKKAPHRGGKYIWQIAEIRDYLLCWKELPGRDPRKYEICLLDQFIEIYNDLPFANLVL